MLGVASVASGRFRRLLLVPPVVNMYLYCIYGLGEDIQGGWILHDCPSKGEDGNADQIRQLDV
jgi:hypothetical protein